MNGLEDDVEYGKIDGHPVEEVELAVKRIAEGHREKIGLLRLTGTTSPKGMYLYNGSSSLLGSVASRLSRQLPELNGNISFGWHVDAPGNYEVVDFKAFLEGAQRDLRKRD